MKISNSAVSMNSTHSEAQVNSSVTATILRQNGRTRMSVSSSGSLSASVNISAEAKAKLHEQNKLLSDLKKESQKNNSQAALTTGQPVQGIVPNISNGYDKFNFQALKKILEAMHMFRKGSFHFVELEAESSKSESLRFQLTSNSLSQSGSTGSSSAPSTVWNREIRTSNVTAEAENTTFAAQGLVQTSDGGQIAFRVDLEMSREFLQATEFVTNDTVKIMTDPLVINMDVDSADVSDQKFFFDIDCDGKEDEISQLGNGSGFLALDKNGDGVINDGSELFGARTGDGFEELAQYDSDGNGWIDENDDIFQSLKVWTKDKDGNDSLLSLKEADVGAIYLGNVSTEFSVKEDVTNETNAQIRKTGVYLHESGGAGTVQHVDFAL